MSRSLENLNHEAKLCDNALLLMKEELIVDASVRLGAHDSEEEVASVTEYVYWKSWPNFNCHCYRGKI